MVLRFLVYTHLRNFHTLFFYAFFPAMNSEDPSLLLFCNAMREGQHGKIQSENSDVIRENESGRRHTVALCFMFATSEIQ